MDWFLYDNGLRHESVKLHALFQTMYNTCKSLNLKTTINNKVRANSTYIYARSC